jgi:hypothetical protein
MYGIIHDLLWKVNEDIRDANRGLDRKKTVLLLQAKEKLTEAARLTVLMMKDEFPPEEVES